MAAKAKKGVKSLKKTNPKASKKTKGSLNAKVAKAAAPLITKKQQKTPVKIATVMPKRALEIKSVKSAKDARNLKDEKAVATPKNRVRETASETVAPKVQKAKVDSAPAIVATKKTKEISDLKNIIEKNKAIISKVTDSVVKDVVKEAEAAGNKIKEIKGKVAKQITAKRDQIMKKMEERALDGLSQAARRWQLLFEKSRGIRAQVYEMSGDYKADSPIQHKVLGWGYILSKKDNRIEVLFREGIKTLITKYSP